MAASSNALIAAREKASKTIPFGFVGPTYTSSSIYADGEELINLYVEPIESGHGANSAYLRKCPGLTTPRYTLPTFPLRGQRDINNRSFAVAGNVLYELFDTLGVYLNRGAVPGVATGPVSMADSGDQLLIVGVGVTPTVFDLRTNSTLANACPASAFQCGYIDGYFVALEYNSRKFWISGLFDATAWSGLDFGARSGSGDLSRAMLTDHGQLWLWGNKRAEVWYNSGAASFPFQRIPQAVIPMGNSAPASAAYFDNTVFWLGGNEQGEDVVYRASGWTPERISNHAMESQIQKYVRRDDAFGWAYQQDGHVHFMLTFPSAYSQLVYTGGLSAIRYRGVTWCWDAATRFWHKRGFWDVASGVYEAHRAQCHASSFGVHLVGDRVSGNVYELNQETYTDNGAPLRWLRSAPHISSQELWNFYESLQIYMQPGTSEDVGMQYSNDGGNIWGAELHRTAGAAGQYLSRVLYNRLGKARNRCFRAFGAGDCPTAIIDAYIKVIPGNVG